jgi:GT2 family glycosyltransferase
MLSVVIPSYKDPLLHKTIDSLIENAEGEIEIIPVLDGYWPETPIKTDKRVKVVHLGGNRGMRGAINAGVRVANGEFIMRTDEHCMFAKGFDRILTQDCGDKQIMTPRRYYLDPVRWAVMDLPPVDYEKLKVRTFENGKSKFEGVNWRSKTKERADILIDETMAMQGSCWIMRRSWWDTIGELETEGYGPHYQDSHEMVFKTWERGGKLLVNKNTWFAHKHVSFPRSHNYGGQSGDPNIEHCYNTWIDFYNNKVKPRWKLA